jgi:hypothetical protein
VDQYTAQVVQRMEQVAAADLPFEDFMAQAVRIIPTVRLAHRVADALRDGAAEPLDPSAVGARRLQLAITAGVFLPEDALV